MSDWQESALHDVLLEQVKEQRLRRRWGIFFKVIFLALFGFIVYYLFLSDDGSSKLRSQPHTALIDINGTIMDGGDTDADRVAMSLRNAFEDKGTKGIVLRINSPGGSPVQANYIYNEITRLSALHPDVKIYSVCMDICASAAYYIAAATSQIYADPNSLVGSIGVLFDGFGFVDTLTKLGMTRRLFTSGEHKGFLDPFSPIKADEESQLKSILDGLHSQFIESVKKGRGDRLKENPQMFSGYVWSGTQAKALGLIDGFGSTGYVAREIIKQEKIIDYTQRPNYFERLATRIGASAGDRFVKELGMDQNIKVR